MIHLIISGLNDGESRTKTMSACDGLISTANHTNQPVDMITTTRKLDNSYNRKIKIRGQRQKQNKEHQIWHLLTTKPRRHKIFYN